MSSKHLPAYKAASVLVRQLYDTTKKAPRELRYTLVHRLIGESVDLLVDIDSANRSESEVRFGFIREAQKRMVRINVLMTAAYEQRCISKGAAALFVESLSTLEKQLEGWARYTQKSLVGIGQSKLESSTDDQKNL
jgi:hypothetical protein